MRKEILFLLVLLSFRAYSQNSSKDTIYIIIDNNKNKNLFIFEKENNNQNASIRVFDNNNQIIKKSKQKKKNNIVKIYPKIPNYNYIDYYSILSPKHITSIKNLKIFTIEDLSKNQDKITNSQVIIFIEKLSDNSYNLWSMNVSYQE